MLMLIKSAVCAHPCKRIKKRVEESLGKFNYILQGNPSKAKANAIEIEMCTIVKLKRKISDEPADCLIIECKKKKKKLTLAEQEMIDEITTIHSPSFSPSAAVTTCNKDIQIKINNPFFVLFSLFI